MAASQWFDLSDFNSKLERIGDGHGNFQLRMELDRDRLSDIDDDELLNAGWVHRREEGSDVREVLVFDRPLVKSSDIANSIGMFFSVDEIKGSYAPQDMMRQDEQMDGIQDRKYVPEWELVESTAGLAAGDRDRITNAVAGAIKRAQARAAREQDVPFDRKGFLLFDHLTDFRLEREPAAGEVSAAKFSLGIMREAMDNRGSLLADNLDRIARSLASNPSAPDAEAMKWLDNFSETVVVMGRDAAIPTDLENVRPRDVVLGEMFGQGMLESRAFTDFSVDLTEARTFDSVARSLPFQLKRDNSIPTAVLADHVEATRRATEFIARELSVPPDELVSNQRVVPVRFSYGSKNDTESGYMQAGGGASEERDEVTGEKERDTLAIAVSLSSPGSFVHEVGHLIHRGNGLTDDEVSAILKETGVMSLTVDRVTEEMPDSTEFRDDYLLSDAEIFARAFEAAMVNAAMKSGDRSLESLGGPFVAQPWQRHSVNGDYEVTESFLSRVSEALHARRDHAYDAVNKSEIQPNGELETSVVGARP